MSEEVVRISRLMKMLRRLGLAVTVLFAVTAVGGLCYLWGRNDGKRSGVEAQRALASADAAAERAASTKQLRDDRNVVWRVLNGESCDSGNPACVLGHMMLDALTLAATNDRVQNAVNAYQNRFMLYMTPDDIAAVMDAVTGDDGTPARRCDAFRGIISANRRADDLLASVLADTSRLDLLFNAQPIPLE